MKHSSTQTDVSKTKIRQMLESSEHGQRNTESKSSGGGGGEDRARSKLQQETRGASPPHYSWC